MKNLVRKYFYGDCSWTAPAGVTRVDIVLQPIVPNYGGVSNERVLILDNNCCGWAFGCNSNGSLGIGTTTAVCQPTALSCPYLWRSLEVGDSSMVGLRDTGDAYGWGPGSCGKNGDGSITDRCVPTLVCCGLKWKQVYAGATHALGISCTGDGYAWGSGNCGRTGIGSQNVACLPTPICCGFKWRMLSAGTTQSMGIDLDGNGYAWGSGACGRLGTGDQNNTCQPTAICCGFKWKCLYAGDVTAYGITLAGDLYAWGSNNCGQIGDNTKTTRCQPTLVCCGFKWKALGVPRSTNNSGPAVYGITEGGDMYVWGSSQCGRQGIGTIGSAVCQPTLVCCGIKWKWVNTGNPNVIAITTDGEVYTWGDGLSGSAGNNTANPQCLPTPVGCCSLFGSVDTPMLRKNFSVTPGCAYCLRVWGALPHFNFEYIVGRDYCADAMVLEYWT